MIAEPQQMLKNLKADQWLDRPVFSFWQSFTLEKLIIILLIILTVTTRFYDLGARVMAHDEVNHVVPAYDLYQGRGYHYDPVTHGPFQFHMIAFSYFIFGASDFSARVPAALFGIAIVLFTIFAWRRYLGRVGALIGGLLFAISPYILFYSRYTRNEIFIVFWGLVMLWLFLRYLEDGESKYLLGLAAITGFHYADKATSYIFTAEACIFLAIYFLYEVFKRPWKKQQHKMTFFILVGITIFLMLASLLVFISRPETSAEPELVQPDQTITILLIVSIGAAFAVLILALIYLVAGMGMEKVRSLRSFDLIVLQLSLILPLLSALIMNIIGWDPLDYSESGMIKAAIVLVPMTLISIFIGLLWNRRVWLRSALIFWSIFLVFYTTLFTQGSGFFTGIMGALGYWMSQQTVQRGTQPLYYYAFVQIPIYEFLPALGSIFALIIGFTKRLFVVNPVHPYKAIENDNLTENDEHNFEEIFSNLETENGQELQDSTPEVDEGSILQEPKISNFPIKSRFKLFTEPPFTSGESQAVPTLLLLLFWSLISLVAFTLAGERMPWLTTHIALPLILSTAWGLGYLLEKTDWEYVQQKKGVLVFLISLLLIFSMNSLLRSLSGSNPPFQGKELIQMQATSTFLLALAASLAAVAGLVYLLKDWKFNHFVKVFLTSFFLILTIITFRTSFRAAFINYDNAKEYLVYAHATRDMKDVFEQVEMISKRLYGDKSIDVAYDNDSLYPFWWYFRDYPNKRWYNDTPTKDLRDAPIILVGDSNFSKIEPLVGDNFYKIEYKRMWWPMEDYRNQTIKSVWELLKDPLTREGLWQIWFNRDYEAYAKATGKSSLTLATWSPASGYRMYIRKDIAQQIWEYGLAPQPEEPKVDPYAAGIISLEADKVITVLDGTTLSYPRDIAIAPDGSLYVADAGNHRIVHLDSGGAFIKAWGGYANVLDGPAPEGLFNEPWGVAVSQDGFVYVADTWNHRIQKFTMDGEFISLWDTFGTAELPDGFWGPRGVAIDSMGHVFVTDTGKQRVVVFDSNGNYITQFGGIGFQAGQMDEPVGIAVNDLGLVFIADTWNYRIQIFAPNLDYTSYTSILSWDVDAWDSQSLDNKPFLAINSDNDIFVTDPSSGRVLQFDDQGNFIQLWGGYDNASIISIACGIAIDQEGRVWVSDSLTNSLLRFTPP